VASGKLGRLAVEAALARVPAEQLVLSTRTPEALLTYADRGAQVRYANFDEPDSLPAAFEGVERMFLISASNGTGKRQDQHGAAFRAARAAGVQRIVFPSMPKVDDPSHPVGLTAEEYREAEESLVHDGIPYVVIRDAPYSELRVIERFLPIMASGAMRINTGEGTAGFISRKDVARTAIDTVLSDDSSIEGHIFDLSGPEQLTFRDVAELLAEVSGHPLQYVEIDDETFAQEARAAGVSDLMVDALTGMGRAVREGYFAVQTDAVQELTGLAPQSLLAVLEEHREELVAAAADR
jgi:NAD(P)H dehydrogenase (quinone)